MERPRWASPTGPPSASTITRFGISRPAPERGLAQNIQRRLKLAVGVSVACAARGFHSALVHATGIVQPAQLLERLSAVIVGRGVIGVHREQRFILLDREFQAARISVL